MGTHCPLTRPRARQNDGSLMVNDWLMSHMRASCDVATVHASYARSVSANFAWFLLGWRRIHWAEAEGGQLAVMADTNSLKNFGTIAAFLFDNCWISLSKRL